MPFGARDYDAQTGRWLAKDPIVFKAGKANLYVYAGNDPINHRDASGLFGIAIGGSGGLGFGFPLGGSYDVGTGIVIDWSFTDGLTIAGYKSDTASLGAGAYAGLGVDFTINFGDLKDFAGKSLGAKVDVGFVEKGDVKLSGVLGPTVAAVCGGLGGTSASSTPSWTISTGLGGGLYVGGTLTDTRVEGYNFRSGTFVSY